MSYSEAFSKKGILKISLIAFSIVMWMYFYTSSNISLKALIVFNLPVLVNSFLTLDFLFLLLFFPVTSAICIALSMGKERNLDLLEVFLGIASGFLISFIFFGFSLNFLIFILFYTAAHLILSILTYNKFKERDKLSVLSNYANTKISLLLTLALFLVVFLIILPNQASYAQGMQEGIVNVFVGEDIGNWLGTSYSISKASTVSAVNFIVDSSEFRDLKRVQDPVVYKYVDYLEDLQAEASKKTTREDIEKIYANLNTTEIKTQVLSAISSMPLMIVVTKFFALFYALIIASMAQIYFSISFSLFGLLYVFIFSKVFNNKREE